MGDFIGVSNNILEQHSNIVIGHGSDTTKSNTITIGIKSISNHNNTIIIGNNIITKCENDIYLGNNEFTDNDVKLNDEQVIVYTNNALTEVKCHACDLNIITGIAWKYDDEDILLKLCFQCIYDTVLHFKSRESWIKKTGFDPIAKLTKDVETLQNEIKNIKNNK
jgi:hypothetical protein